MADKTKLPSRHVSVGPERAPHRSYYYAMGMTEEDINKPFVGVVSTWNEAAPCNIALMRQAQSVKKGVKEMDGTPREFCTITVTDGIAMGHEGMKSSLVSREVIADSIELMVRAPHNDALLGIAGCDKSLPGTMMGMIRLNIPSVFVYGGTIMPGMLDGRELTVVDVYEAVGSYDAGKITAEELENIICRHRETPRDIIKNPINAIEEASKICEIDDVALVIIGSVSLVGDILNYIISRDNLNFWEELRVHR